MPRLPSSGRDRTVLWLSLPSSRLAARDHLSCHQGQACQSQREPLSYLLTESHTEPWDGSSKCRVPESCRRLSQLTTRLQVSSPVPYIPHDTDESRHAGRFR